MAFRYEGPLSRITEIYHYWRLPQTFCHVALLPFMLAAAPISYHTLRVTTIYYTSSRVHCVALYLANVQNQGLAFARSFPNLASLRSANRVYYNFFTACRQLDLRSLPGRFRTADHSLLFHHTYNFKAIRIHHFRYAVKAVIFVAFMGIYISFLRFEFPCFLFLSEWLLYWQTNRPFYYLNAFRMLCHPVPIVVRMLGYVVVCGYLFRWLSRLDY